ncbi:MAG: formate dehydrogenase accessory sulfurtransferase FdhD [Vicinamibacterales bacterium]
MTRRATVAPVVRLTEDGPRPDQDLVAVESPLRLDVGRAGDDRRWPLGLLMRTPGDDADLVHGLLFTEGVITRATDVERLTLVPGPARGDAPGPNAAGAADSARPNAAAVPDSAGRNAADAADRADDGESAGDGDAALAIVAASIDLADLLQTRVLVTTSACGLCGRLADVRIDRLGTGVRERPSWPAALVASLPDLLAAGQAVFAETGGLHAAGLFDAEGRRLLVREDVGRHNAVDKVLGAALREGRLPATDGLLVVSGRAAYEIVQKAAVAGVAGLVAVGAPSSLAVEAARAAGLTLVGFARGGRFNVYAGHGRIGDVR